jgi:hypothetical protein
MLFSGEICRLRRELRRKNAENMHAQRERESKHEAHFENLSFPIF